MDHTTSYVRDDATWCVDVAPFDFLSSLLSTHNEKLIMWFYIFNTSPEPSQTTYLIKNLIKMILI